MIFGLMVGPALLSPDAINGLLSKLKVILPDAKLIQESESVLKWEGSYQGRRGRKSVQLPVAAFLYKSQKRLRIQVTGEDRAEAEAVAELIASELGASTVARSSRPLEEAVGQGGQPAPEWVVEQKAAPIAQPNRH